MPEEHIRISILGPPLSGRGTWLGRVCDVLGTSLEAHPQTQLTTTSFRWTGPTFDRRVELGRLGLLGAISAASFQDARKINRHVAAQEAFLRESSFLIFMLDGQEILRDRNLESLWHWQDLCAEVGFVWDIDRVLFLVGKADLPKIDSPAWWSERLQVPECRLCAVSAESEPSLKASLDKIRQMIEGWPAYFPDFV